jgi:hypothetical protein
MHRVVLLAPLWIPILIVIHAAGVMFLAVDTAGNHLQWHGRWQAKEPITPVFFVVVHAPEGGA